MERRNSILKLDSDVLRFARAMIKSSEEDTSILEAVVDSHDKLTEAVVRMRENAEMIIGAPDRTYDLKESIQVANKVLHDRPSISGEATEKKSIDIDEGLNAEVSERLSDDVIP